MADEILDPAAGAVDPGASTSTNTDPGTTDPGAGAVDPAAALDPAGDPAATEPDEFAAFEGLFPKDEEDPAAAAAAAADPNAAQPAVPEAVTRALGISEYVKDPAHLENAVRAADEVFQVQMGKIPAHQMLEGFRARDPQGFERIVKESLIPYIEHITGQKLGGAAAEPPDPVAALAAEVERLKQQPIVEAQQRQEAQQRATADTATRTHVETLIKAGSGVFDGATDDAINAMAAQLPKLGLTPAKLMADVLAGKTADLDRAYKAAEKAELARVKAMGSRLIARSKALKGAVPPGKGNPAPAVAGELPENATREQMVAYLRGQ